MAENTLKEQDEDQEEQLIIVETPPRAAESPDDDDEDDRAPAARVDDATTEPEGETESEREAIRERRRQEKLERKARRDEAIRRDKLEMDFLRKRNDDLERRLTAQEQRSVQVDLNTIDAEIARARQEKDMAERVIAKAVAAGNGEDVAQAMRYRDAAAQREQQLAYQKQQRMTAPPAAAPEDGGLDPRVKRLANKFMTDHQWYNPAGDDEDSAVVIALDQVLAREGYDPTTPDYWDELTDRVRRRLPEKFAAASRDDPPPPRTPRGGPSVGSGRDQNAPAGARQREFYISPERKQALIDAGVWDDPVLRARYVKKYAEYDKKNQA